MATVITRPLPQPVANRPRRARTAPVILRGGGTARLEKISLSKGEYSEKWLQDLIHAQPELLAVSEIEPAFGTLLPVAREIPCGHGIIDNLFITPSGEIVLVETKLWRNPQARREVVAQALDYVAALMDLGYEQLEQQLNRAEGNKIGSLYALISQHPDALDESAFIDAVSRNLARGRMLILAVGDGIHQEAERLVDLLQSHAGAHFTFALVEVATWRDIDTGDIIAVPDVLAQTVMIERGVVTIENGVPRIKPAPAKASSGPQSISAEMFYEKLADRSPALPQQLKAFVAELASLGVYADQRNTLTLRVDPPNRAKPLNLGYITKEGQLWTENVLASAPADAAMVYLEALAAMIGGTIKQGTTPYASTNGTSAPRLEQLLPNHAQAWRDAAAALIDAARSAED